MSVLDAASRVAARPAHPPGDCHVALHSDLGLVVCIVRHRHQAALAEVHRRHGGSVYGLATRLLGPDRGVEVTRRVLIDLWQDPGRFDPDRSSLRGYLLARTHALATDVSGTDGEPVADPTRRPSSWRSRHHRLGQMG